MKISLSKQLGTTLTTLLVIAGTITISCNSGRHQPDPPTRTFTPVPTPETCGGVISGEESVEDSILWPGEECRFRFLATAGDTATIEMDKLDETLDPYLELLDPDGSLLAENDDDDPVSLNSRISAQPLWWDGWYTIVARSYLNESSGRFELTLERVGVPDTGLTPPCRGTIVYGETLRDTILWPGEECHFRFFAVAGDTVTIGMHKLDETLDPYLELLDPNGLLLAENDDDDPVSLNSRISAQPLWWDGWYTIVARSYLNESSGRFELTLAKTEAAED